MKSHFFAYMAKMKYIKRWGIMRNTVEENIQEHSLQAAMIAHALALVKNRVFGGNVNPERVMALAVYHEAGEVITGDLPTPIKYFNPEISKEYKKIEAIAEDALWNMLPEALRSDYDILLKNQKAEDESYKLVKAADKICAYIKCVEEINTGNGGFLKAKETLEKAIAALGMPEVDYFMETFIDSFSLTLDELN
jgi:5'-deoxynucleotidase